MAADAGFFGDKLLGIESTLEAETSVSDSIQYKLFIGDDKNNTPFGVTFSFNLLIFLVTSSQPSSTLYKITKTNICMLDITCLVLGNNLKEYHITNRL